MRLQGRGVPKLGLEGERGLGTFNPVFLIRLIFGCLPFQLMSLERGLHVSVSAGDHYVTLRVEARRSCETFPADVSLRLERCLTTSTTAKES